LKKTNIILSVPRCACVANESTGGTVLKLGNNLKRYRFECDFLSQAALARAIGVSRQTIIAIEKRRLVPSVLLALKIAYFLKEPVDEIFYIDEGE